MFARQGFMLMIFIPTIVMMLGIQSHQLNADTDSANGVRVSTYANGWYTASTVYSGQYVWTAWSDFTASMSASGREIGDTADGWYKQKAYLPLYGATNPPDVDEEFELKITGWWIFKFGDSEINHHYSAGQSSS